MKLKGTITFFFRTGDVETSIIKARTINTFLERIFDMIVATFKTYDKFYATKEIRDKCVIKYSGDCVKEVSEMLEEQFKIKLDDYSTVKNLMKQFNEE